MSKKQPDNASQPIKFEEALARMEAIVGNLEKGDLPLEESLAVFEEGVRLSKSCLKMLEESERKVEILLQDKDGKKRARPFEPDEEASDGGNAVEERD